MNTLTFLIFIPVVFWTGFMPITGIIDIASKSKNKYVDNAGFLKLFVQSFHPLSSYLV